MSHLGIWGEEPERGTLWCLLASLLASWTFSSHAQHNAASSAQHSTFASAASHTLHWIFIFSVSFSTISTNFREKNPNKKQEIDQDPVFLLLDSKIPAKALQCPFLCIKWKIKITHNISSSYNHSFIQICKNLD